MMLTKLAFCFRCFHLRLIMGSMASQIISLTIVYSTVYSDADQRKHQSSASLAFVWGIHRGPVNTPHKWPVTRKMFPFDDVIMSAFTNMVYSKTKHNSSRQINRDYGSPCRPVLLLFRERSYALTPMICDYVSNRDWFLIFVYWCTCKLVWKSSESSVIAVVIPSFISYDLGLRV